MNLLDCQQWHGPVHGTMTDFSTLVQLLDRKPIYEEASAKGVLTFRTLGGAVDGNPASIPLHTLDASEYQPPPSNSHYQGYYSFRRESI